MWYPEEFIRQGIYMVNSESVVSTHDSWLNELVYKG